MEKRGGAKSQAEGHGGNTCMKADPHWESVWNPTPKPKQLQKEHLTKVSHKPEISSRSINAQVNLQAALSLLYIHTRSKRHMNNSYGLISPNPAFWGEKKKKIKVMLQINCLTLAWDRLNRGSVPTPLCKGLSEPHQNTARNNNLGHYY